jgi:poly(hydroxyalkanoate) depolymerase family esterase
MHLPCERIILKILDQLPARLLESTQAPETSVPVRPFDGRAITDTIRRALAAAGLDTEAGLMKGVTATIEHALSAAGLIQRAAPSAYEAPIEVVAREIETPHDGTDPVPIAPTAPTEPAHPGTFVSRSFANDAGARTYKLYVPASYAEESSEPVPMIVMLHGCTQSPNEFAEGTRMNALADQHGFLVVYPAQAPNANGAKCWNWFRSEDQTRDRGEPSLIAGITREVASSYRVDERRIFVAGLSAGAAMAVILGVTYPELYAAVGAHSGLPYGAAHDLPSAFGAMKGGGAAARMRNPPAAPMARRPYANYAVPTIVFHGDCDHTVDPRNGTAIVEQATVGRSDESRLRASVREGTASGGRTYSHTIYVDAANQPVVEQWVLHGAGHAWSGGSPNGSFTDACGPEASAEMIRFFFSLQRAGTA